MVTLVTFVTLVTCVLLIVVLLPTLFWMRMPTFTTGGALVTTAGDVPMGAGTIRPMRDPGGAGTNTPCGPMGAGPRGAPAMATARVMRALGGGGTKATPGAHQWPVTKTTTPLRCS